ncbi:T9SS type A sorting domain-containing protein [Aequorivita sp. CIP111184]|uniref:T9SS type A sorting domain-containing protein n=1 Tax=Aequorivita sp. CIP111184 TaxID=2211356 RepID=UPI0015EC949A|nr:T9SS type A sorting domain-containing protein [Aequorivita sp. CIP111184]
MKKLILLFIFSISSLSVFAQQIQLFRQLNGRYDYTAIGNTLNAQENNSPSCTILSQSSATLTLNPGQTLVSAMLYWSGSSAGDFEIKLNGTEVNAERTFSVVNNGLPLFAAYADVTSIVETQGNGTYTFSDMDIMGTLSDYCNFGINYGGWSIIVVFEDPSLLLNQVSLFDGLESVSSANNTLNITLTNIEAVSDQLSRIGFLAWEGDQQIAVGESLFINNTMISNLPLNPPNNAFNSTNSYTNSNQLYNMDLDYYDLQGIVNPGDTQIDIELTSQQDLIMVNNIITVVNSELPDGTIAIDGVTVSPLQDELEVTYTVSNVNSTNVLPANTSITFYADNVLIAEDFTNQDIPIGGTLTDGLTISLPVGTPSNFALRAVIDGNGVIPETNEGNNEFELQISLSVIANPAPDLVECDINNDGGEEFDLTVNDLIIIGSQNPNELQLTYHKTQVDADNGNNPIANPWNYFASAPFERIFARLEDMGTGDYDTTNFDLVINPTPPDYGPFEMMLCDDELQGSTPTDEISTFDLTENNQVITGGDPSLTVAWFLSSADEAADLPIPNPTSYQNLATPQTVIGRVENTFGCKTLVTLTLSVLPNPNPNQNPDPLELCDDDNDGIIGGWDLTLADINIINGETDVNIKYYETLQSAQNGIPGTEILGLYANTVPFNQTVYARVTKSVPPAILPCYAIAELELIVKEIPPITQPNNLFINENDGDGFAIFDLTVNIPVMLAGLNPSDYVVSFYETELDAQSNTIPITPPTTYENVVNPQTIYVRVENVNSGCYLVTSFEIATDELAPDADGDGIANEDEDLNNNGNLNDDDTDGDGIPNYLDSDDDGDTVQTIDETTGIGAGVVPSYIYIDTDGDTIENYLDNDDDGDGTLTIDEDYNNNGTPIDDDTNSNSIPDFLDDEVFLAVNSFFFNDLELYPNPTSESFTLQSAQLVSETTISLYDTQGKKLISEKMLPQNGTLTINVSSLENGVYFVKISSEGNSVVKKLLKN